MIDKEKQPNKTMLVVFIAGLTALLCIRHILFISLSKWILVAFCCLFAVGVPYETLIYMLCFMFPLFCGIPRKYILLMFLILLLAKKRKVDGRIIVFLFYWIVKEIVATFWVTQPEWIELVGYCVHVCLLFYLILNEDVLNYKRCVDIYLLGTIILCGIIIVRTLLTAPSNWLYLFSNGWFRFGMAEENTSGMVIELNANSLAYYAVVGLACSLFLFTESKGKQSVLYGLTAAVCLITGLMTVSRSFLLVAALLIIWTLIFVPKNPRMTLGILFAGVLVVCGGMRILQSHPELLQGLTARLNNSNMATGGGRSVLFAKYLDAFLANHRLYFTGTGVTSYKEITGIYNSMHNATEQIFICYGIFGSILFFIGLLIPVVRCLRNNGTQAKMKCLPFIAVILFIQTIQFVNPDMLMMPYVISIYCLRVRGKSDEEFYCDS